MALTTALTGDETTFELTDDTAGMNYEDGVALAQHDYRQAIAQAEHDLEIGGTQADYAAQVAAAAAARAAAYDQAYADFATLVKPAMTAQGLADANAEEFDALTIDNERLADIVLNNQAVTAYKDQEAADYAAQQKAQAQALYAYQVASANGHAAAIAAFAQSNASPWADLAAAQAAADAAQQVAQATAQLAQSLSAADAQQTEEQAQNDAQEAKDDATAQAEHDQAAAEAQSQHDEETAQAAVSDEVFENLPDTLIAPAEGPTPTLTPDLIVRGYETGDLYLYPTQMPFDVFSGMAGGWSSFYVGPPNFMPGGLGIAGFAYDWPTYGAGMPFGLLGSYSASSAPSAKFGVTSVIPGGGGLLQNAGGGLPLRDLVRTDYNHNQPSKPIAEIYAGGMHIPGAQAALLDASQTPGAIGVGGYSQSSIPTSQAAGQLAAGANQRSSGVQTTSYSTFGAPQTPAEGSGGGSQGGSGGDGSAGVQTLSNNSSGRSNSPRGAGLAHAWLGDVLREMSDAALLTEMPDEVQRQLAKRRMEIEAEAQAKQTLDWVMHGGEHGTTAAPMAVGPDGEKRVLVFWVDGQAFTWREGDDGRWKIQMLVRPENVTPEEWTQSGHELWEAAASRDPTPVEQAAIDGFLGTYTKNSRENWLAENLPKDVFDELGRTGALIGVVSGNGETLIELERMLHDPKVSDKEILKFLLKESAYNATIGTLFNGVGMVLGPAAKKLAGSSVFKRLLQQGDELAKKVVGKLDDIASTLKNAGAGKSLSKAEQDAVRQHLDDLKKLANADKLDRAVASDVRAALEEAEAAFAREIVPAVSDLPARELASFTGSKVTPSVTKSEITLYRVYGGEAGRKGSYFTTIKPTSAEQASKGLALKPSWGNSEAFVVEVKVPPGTPIYSGTATAQGTLPGGWVQIFIPREWLPGVKFGRVTVLH